MSKIGAAFEALRVHQWVKNVLIFVPLLLGGKAADVHAWQTAFLGFLAFGLTASATYVINDLRDLPFDRQHAAKKFRPIASGAVSVPAAIVLAVITLGLGLQIAYGLGRTALAAVLAYVGLTLAYTFWLKRQAIIDVVAIAALFSLRLAFGTVLAGVRWSAWLYVFSMCAFVSLALSKRFAELSAKATDTDADADALLPGRGYFVADMPFVRGLGLASATTAVLIMILYLINEAFPHGVYAHPQRLWCVPAILFLFFGRIWLAAERREIVDDPLTFALRDWQCLTYGVLLALTFVSAAI